MRPLPNIPKSILITRPRGDQGLKYLEAWSRIIIDAAQKKGAAVLDLSGCRAIGSKLIASDNKSSENSQLISALYWDFKHQVCLGNKDAQI